MSTNMTLIEAKTVGSGGIASVTFSDIPQTYTDLKLVVSARLVSNGDSFGNIHLSFNGAPSGSSYNAIAISGDGSNSGYASFTSKDSIWANYTIVGSAATSSVFSNGEYYIHNYTSNATPKVLSIDSVGENNAAEARMFMYSGIWNPGTQAAIINMTLTAHYNPSELFAENSTFYLYGISKVTSSPKATGGIVSQDVDYWYHMFPFTSTFTPTQALSADILCVAGGGGGAKENGTGGGGAGGLLAFTSQSLSATGYTVTVGAGGSGATVNSTNGNTGGDSQFGALTLVKGGGYSNSGTGGSGGGAYPGSTGGSATSGQGNAGGNGIIPFASPYPSGGGGGAGAAGANGSGSQSGNCGIGVNTYASWANATFTGENGYFAGGGGGGTTSQGATAGAGGFGGGAAGGPNNGLANTGGGGGGGLGGMSSNGGSGGSGVVIVRYAK